VVILTMHDVSLKPADQKAAVGGTLLLEGTVKTYRYLDDEEQSAVARAKNPKGGAPAKGGRKAGGE
jgi:type IV pilus assembly protein PilO